MNTQLKLRNYMPISLIQITLQYTKENKTTTSWAIQSFSATTSRTWNMHAWKVPPTKNNIALAEFLCSYLPCQHEWFSALIRRSCWKILRLRLCTLRTLEKITTPKTKAAPETWHFQQESCSFPSAMFQLVFLDFCPGGQKHWHGGGSFN